MVVLDKDGCRRIGELLLDSGGETRVDLLIGIPITRSKHRPHMRHVTERPQPLVGEPFVVAFGLVGRQPYSAERVGRVVRGHDNTVVRVDNVPVRPSSAVRNPHPAALSHQSVEGNRDAAGRRRPDDPSVVHPVVLIGLAVRHDDERSRGTVDGVRRRQVSRHLRNRPEVRTDARASTRPETTRIVAVLGSGPRRERQYPVTRR